MTIERAAIAIRPAVLGDRQPVTGTLAAAFAAGPLAEWLIPDPVTRLQVYLAYSRATYDHALHCGLIDTTYAFLAAAVWYPRGGAPTPTPETEPDPALVMLVGVSAARRFAHLDEAMAARTPAAPHHHLAFLGVYPSAQRRGIGSALLQHRHALLDAAGQPAFLVATSEGSRDLYLRHGYVVCEEFTAATSPPLWAMWREPHGRS